MAEYIEREALKQPFDCHTVENDGELYLRLIDVATFHESIPAADVVDVVRCKDCKHCFDAHNDGLMYCMRPIAASDYSETGYLYPLEVPVGFYEFCSHGERK